jgi:ATP-dependent Clp protease adaptor protein ClpS
MVIVIPSFGAQSMADTSTEPLVAEPRSKPKSGTRTRRIPPYNLILANDEHHSMDFVVDVLRKILGIPIERAVAFMLEAHTSGRAIIWTGPKEVAELKAEQMHTCHEVRDRDKTDLGPLGCTIEPAPGA